MKLGGKWDIGKKTRHYFNCSWVENHLLAFERKIEEKNFVGGFQFV
jgi:hypothetical protein